MRIRKIILLITAYIFLISCLLSGCVKNNTDSKERTSSLVETQAYQVNGKNGYMFDPPVIITSFRYYNPNIRFNAGEDIDRNVWTEAYTDLLGIDLVNQFSTTSSELFYNKVSQLIAANTLPDVMSVPRSIYFKMLEANSLSDLTTHYNNYAGEEIKSVFEEFNSGLLKKACTYKNKLYAIAPPPIQTGDLLWLRNDWLNKLNIKWPRDISNIIGIIRRFSNSKQINNGQKNIYGLAMDKDLTLLKGFANAYGVYSDIWIKSYNNEIIRGETDYNWLPVLSDLRNLYAYKSLDPNFDKKSLDDLNNDFTQQILGAVFGSYRLPDTMLGSSAEMNPEAEWLCSLIPFERKAAKVQLNSNIKDFFCVSANSQYPQSLLLMLNLWSELATGSDRSLSKYISFNDKFGNTYESFEYPPFGFSSSINDLTGIDKNITRIKDLDQDISLSNQELYLYNNIKTWEENKSPDTWKSWAIFNPLGSLSLEKKIISKKYYVINQTGCYDLPLWQTFGADLEAKYKQYFIRIIKGDYNSVDEGFREWMKYFNKNGGPEATEEVNTWYKKNPLNLY